MNDKVTIMELLAREGKLLYRPRWEPMKLRSIELVLESDTPLDRNTIDRIREQFQRYFPKGRVIVFDSRLKIRAIHRSTPAEVARRFGLPPHKLKELSS